jgi:DNA-binding MurR/RpiR family transcriptional regulator
MLPCVEQERVLIVISTIGNSPNVAAAINDARAHEMVTIGVASFDAGAIKDHVEKCLSLESETGVYGPVENAQVTLSDILTACFMRDCPAMAEVP